MPESGLFTVLVVSAKILGCVDDFAISEGLRGSFIGPWVCCSSSGSAFKSVSVDTIGNPNYQLTDVLFATTGGFWLAEECLIMRTGIHGHSLMSCPRHIFESV